MTPSQRCIDFIKSFEGCRLSAYLPTPNDVWTIGFGSTGPDVRKGMTWTQEQADTRFVRDLNDFATGLNHDLGLASTTQAQFDAMLSLAYNIGIGAFTGSTVLRKHLAGDYPAAADAFVLWDKQAGNVLEGLRLRRFAEAAMYRGE